MKRRGLLALLGGAAVAPASLGPKAAAAILGIDPLPPAPMPVEQAVTESAGIESGRFWGSSAQIAMDARRSALYESTRQDRYAHMKSWSTAFKRSVVQREIQIEKMIEHRAMSDDDFLKRLIAGL